MNAFRSKFKHEEYRIVIPEDAVCLRAPVVSE
jgi:hypothetical protein